MMLMIAAAAAADVADHLEKEKEGGKKSLSSIHFSPYFVR